MNTSDYVLAVVTTLNVITVIINIVVLLKLSDKEADIVTAEKKLIMPVAEVKAEFSEEDMTKIKEMLKKANDNKYVIKQAEDLPVQCDHTYNTMVLMDDPMYCRDKLVFHCRCCNHEEIIPIEKGVVMDFILGGGKT
jgi:hypothetical protein